MIRRLSLGRSMVILSFIAVDIAWVRAAYLRNSTAGLSAGYLAIVLPMANVLLLCLPRLRSNEGSRAFWVGFQVAGWAVIEYLGQLDSTPSGKMILFIPYEMVQGRVPYPFGSAPHLAIIYTFFAVVHTPPQLLLAWLGGLAAARLARLAGLRPKEADRGPDEDPAV